MTVAYSRITITHCGFILSLNFPIANNKEYEALTLFERGRRVSCILEAQQQLLKYSCNFLLSRSLVERSETLYQCKLAASFDMKRAPKFEVKSSWFLDLKGIQLLFFFLYYYVTEVDCL